MNYTTPCFQLRTRNCVRLSRNGRALGALAFVAKLDEDRVTISVPSGKPFPRHNRMLTIDRGEHNARRVDLGETEVMIWLHPEKTLGATGAHVQCRMPRDVLYVRSDARRHPA